MKIHSVLGCLLFSPTLMNNFKTSRKTIISYTMLKRYRQVYPLNTPYDGNWIVTGPFEPYIFALSTVGMTILAHFGHLPYSSVLLALYNCNSF